ncbi:MAG: hypothetical protein HYW07_23355 [Candidatus Latescibacteria bacterium]|nr:hypothetical protein [Candidatus Latescibacterota bacterium]
MAALWLSLATAAQAQISFWQLGGGGLSWAESDTTRVMVAVDEQANTIQPVYFSEGDNMMLAVSGWSELKIPRELGYIDGHQPRLWLQDGTSAYFTSYYDSPLYVDGDRSTYNTARLGWWTIDLGVPVPARRFGFLTPTEGFRSDGVPLNQDPVPAFEVSVSEESDPALELRDYHRLNTLIADVQENFAEEVEIEFPPQYVRFIRYNRNASVLDEQTISNTVRGTIAEFVLHGQGVPKRAIYLTQIIDLGAEVNFGRIFWAVSTWRMVAGAPVETPGARAWVEVEARSGRDSDPNVYHEYTDSGKELFVSRQRYEHELRQPETEGVLQLDRRPGIQASIAYDLENWSFWSIPLTQSGSLLELRNGAYLQLQITLQSRAFGDFVRLDSVWIEQSPPLADQVLGEVALLDEPRPALGFTQVELGRRAAFAYDLRAIFASAAQGGFDAVRLRAGSRPRFLRLEMGEPLVRVEPAGVAEEEEGLVVLLPEKVTGQRNVPARVVFDTEVFLHATTFEGEVSDSKVESLPQPIEPGDAGDYISTGSLRVLGGRGRTPGFIEDLELSGAVVTPNGDGINDRLTIRYNLFLLPEPIPVELNVHDLQGRRRLHLEVGAQEAGPQEVFWDGRDNEGRLLEPGIYLVDIRLRSELKDLRQVRPVGLAY